MMNMNKDEQLTKYLVQFCYTCDRAHECTNEAATAHCMTMKQYEAGYTTTQDETLELLRWYEQI
ncbi:hypothetical protein H8B09_28620 [Paenibacillus sp. PR3]|uniref:Uncharacterized protein n=1 Tax=Paenibacillus terricola TaxID=2763503 RepID=A0ABR8N3I1_9BACL|nr:hypothetical protein [Paenibacillus terricola]MBD3922708.1 hypothetical protein [Paenibacillus terricola]